MKKRARLISNAYKNLALSCLKLAISDEDYSLLSKKPANVERLDLLCSVAEIDRNKFIKRLTQVRDEDKRFQKRAKYRDYMREYLRRRREQETAEEKEKRLAKFREWRKKHKGAHYES